MTNNEIKVIKGLECCGFGNCNPKDCPYYVEMDNCRDMLMHNAIALLKAQEPHVMTLEEVIAHYSLPPVFPDDLDMQEDYYEDIRPLYFEFPNDSEDWWIVHWRGHAQVARYLNEWKDSYNKKWRCWTARPTDEQRKDTPWGTGMMSGEK